MSTRQVNSTSRKSVCKLNRRVLLRGKDRIKDKCSEVSRVKLNIRYLIASFWQELGFELRASCVQSRRSTA
jgi:hypothetical protein